MATLINPTRAIVLVNAEKVYAASEVAGSSTLVVDLQGIVDPLGDVTSQLVIFSGQSQQMLVLQSIDNDFLYQFGTDPAGTIDINSAVYVKAFEQEYVQPASQVGRVYLYLARAGSSDANVNIFAVKTAG